MTNVWGHEMSSLALNKVMAAVCVTGLGVLGLQTLGHSVYHADKTDFAYTVEIQEAAAETEVVEIGPPDFGVLLAAADISRGERTARLCISCHTFESDGGMGTGPNLYDIFGRVAGSVEGFRYSNAMVEYGKAWDFQNMYDYLEAPADYVPGTNMSFRGINRRDDRVNLIAYMRTLSDSPVAIPAAAIEAVDVEPMPAVEDVIEAVTEEADTSAPI